MLAEVTPCVAVGPDGALIQVEVDIARGFSNTVVRERHERWYQAVCHSGFHCPGRRIAITLALADLSNEGPAYDAPIVLGVLMSAQQIATVVRHHHDGRAAAGRHAAPR